jgi:cerevisin
MLKQMTFYFYFITHLLFSLGFAANSKYILTSKNDKSDLIAQDHNLELLAKFSDVTFYTTTHDNLMKYKLTLSDFYQIEEDMEIKLNNQEFKSNTNLNVNILQNKTNLIVAPVPWHLGRITNRNLPLGEKFPYDKCHTNTDIDIHTYVIDTGIDIHHPEFEGRATWLANFVDSDDTDCQSHGTHCAGLIGSKTYGVCKDAKLFAVKVLDCQGSGSTSSVISGIAYAFKRHLQQDKKVRSIVSMSLGGGFSYALNKAVLATTKDDHFYFAAAAGNENADACKTSPASVKEIFTVMASDRNDNRAWFSNWGKCADIYSPGVDIISTIPNGKTASYSGTSQSTPILVGVLSHYINMYPEVVMKEMKNKILSDATNDHIIGDKKQTSNLLVFLNRNAN